MRVFLFELSYIQKLEGKNSIYIQLLPRIFTEGEIKMNKRHEKMKHNYDCKGDCRYRVQCALDAAWQELEECLLHEDRRRKLR